MRACNIAVAGAGPAGLAAALALANQGHRITIFEQFDQPRPLGSGLILQPTGLGVLDWLGLGERMRNLGARIDRLHGKSSDSGRTVLDVRYAALGAERGYAVHRAALFNVLFEAVKKAQIDIETSSEVRGFDGKSLVLGDGRKTASFDLVIDALGARSPLAKVSSQVAELDYGAVWASLPWPGGVFDPHALEQRYHKASIMVGVLPIGRVNEEESAQAAFFWSLKPKNYAAIKERGLEALKAEILRHWPAVEGLLGHIKTFDDLVLARYQHHTLRKPYDYRLISIGDAAHAASPQLGQGANMALLDVRALSLAFERHRTLQDVAMDYAARRKKHVRVYQWLSALFTPFYQSDSTVLPFIRDYAVPPLARLPLAQRLLARMVAGTFVAPIGPWIMPQRNTMLKSGSRDSGYVWAGGAGAESASGSDNVKDGG